VDGFASGGHEGRLGWRDRPPGIPDDLGVDVEWLLPRQSHQAPAGDIGFNGHAEQHGHTHAGDDALLDRFDACELERTVG
jgi:hypothetical protein